MSDSLTVYLYYLQNYSREVNCSTNILHFNLIKKLPFNQVWNNVCTDFKQRSTEVRTYPNFLRKSASLEENMKLRSYLSCRNLNPFRSF